MAVRYPGQQLDGSVISQFVPIIGRQCELTLLMNYSRVSRSGHASVVLVAGAPGIGKTRLLDEVAMRVTQEGATVLRGGASEAEGMPPYLPFLEALGRHIQTTSQDSLREQVAAAPHLLASLLPELTIHLDNIPVPPPLPHEQIRLRLFEAVGTFLTAIGGLGLLVLILDDLQWADTQSLELLCHIARHQPNARLFILGAYRDSEIDRNPALVRAVAELFRQRVLTTVAVNPLSVREVEMLATSYLGYPLSAGVSSLLYTQSEGNPFFAEELLDGWIEMGALVQESDRWIAVATLDHALPPSIVGALRQRFVRLSPDVIDHLRIAAMIGRSFDVSLLATVEGQEIEAVEERLLEAVRARLVQADHAGNFTFCHDKIRECLYSEVSTYRRRRLHGLIGHALEARYKHGKMMTLTQLTELAFHFACSGEQTRGVEYCQRAASEALQISAPEEAMTHYRMALELLNSDDARRGDLLLSLGDAALLSGKGEEAEIAYRAVQQCLLLAGDQRAAVRAAHGLGRAQWWQERRLEARAALEHALELSGGYQCAEVIEVLIELSVLLRFYVGQDVEGITYAQQALEMARSLADAHLEAVACRVVAGDFSIQESGLSPTLQLLERTLALKEHLDMAASERSICDQQCSLSLQPGGPARRSLPANLTQREAAILKLVACGKSNRQIAQALGLSAKTVTNHLTHIFDKTISENRAAATAFAIRHGLA